MKKQQIPDTVIVKTKIDFEITYAPIEPEFCDDNCRFNTARYNDDGYHCILFNENLDCKNDFDLRCKKCLDLIKKSKNYEKFKRL